MISYQLIIKQLQMEKFINQDKFNFFIIENLIFQSFQILQYLLFAEYGKRRRINTYNSEIIEKYQISDRLSSSSSPSIIDGQSLNYRMMFIASALHLFIHICMFNHGFSFDGGYQLSNKQIFTTFAHLLSNRIYFSSQFQILSSIDQQSDIFETIEIILNMIKVLSIWNILILAYLLALGYSQLYISDSALDPTNFTNLKTMCSQSPLWNINICNRTCKNCMASDSYACSNCDSQFQLVGSNCVIDNSIHTYKYYSYMRELGQAASVNDISKLKYMHTEVPLSSANLVAVCRTSTFQNYMAGLFQVGDQIGVTLSYTDKIDQIFIKLNVLSVVSDLSVNIAINDQVIYSQKFGVFSNLKGMYIRDANPGPTTSNYLTLDALTSSNAASIIVPITTDIANIITNTINIKIYVTSSSTQQYIWAIDDMVIVLRNCETCVTEAVSDILSKLLTITGYTLLAVVVLVVMLILMIKLEEVKKKRDASKKLGSNIGNMPIKAINRVLEHLQKYKRDFKEESDREDKLYRRLTKAA